MVQQVLFQRFSTLAAITALTIMLVSCAPRPAPQPEPSPYAPVAAPHPYTQPQKILPPLDKTVSEPEQHIDGPEVKVGLLLPLSGESAQLGQSLLDAAMLGLFDKYASIKEGVAQPITLLPKDTEGDKKQAANMAKEAIDDGAQLIIGPLFSDSVKAVRKAAESKHIPVLTFSNNAAVAGKGVYLFGFMPAEQVTQIADYASSQGKVHIAALLPDNAYGQLIEDSLQDYAALQGITLSGIQYYRADGREIGQAVQRLVQRGEKGKPAEIDAILLAENGNKLSLILDKLAQYNLLTSDILLLGTSLWDDITLAEEPRLQGAVFAASPRRENEQFMTRFETAQGYVPSRIASLGYDAVTLAATLLQYDGFTDASLTQPSGFMGPANGIFRLHADGTNERALSILGFDRGTIIEIVPAPRMFY